MSLAFIVAFVAAASGLLIGVVVLNNVSLSTTLSNNLECTTTPEIAGVMDWNLQPPVKTDSLNVITYGQYSIGNYISPDGLHLYTITYFGKLVQYDLASPWIISSGTETPATNPFGLGIAGGSGLTFKNSTTYYIVDLFGGRIGTATTTTPWMVKDTSFPISYVNIPATTPAETSFFGLYISPDGTHLYMDGDDTGRIFEFSLGTPWKMSTISFVRSNPLATGFGEGVTLSSDGTQLLSSHYINNKVYHYTLSTPWNVSTMIQDQQFSGNADLVAEGGGDDFEGISLYPDNSKFYVTVYGVGKIFEYTLNNTSPTAGTHTCPSDNALDMTWTVIGIIPVILFFSIFVVMNGMKIEN